MKTVKNTLSILIIIFSSSFKLFGGNVVGVSLLELIFVFVLFNELFVNRFSYKGQFIKLVFSIIFIQFLSLFFLFNFELSRLLYAFRFVEYFLIGYYIWTKFKDQISISLLISTFTAVSFLFYINKLIYIPFFRIPQLYSNGLYFPFSYVWEASTLFSLFGVFFLDYFKNKKGQFLFFICLIFVYYTNQRSPLIAMIITYSYVEIIKNKKWKLMVLIIFFISFLGLRSFENNRLFIFLDSFSFDNIKLAANIAYEYANMSNSYAEFVYGDRQLLTDNGDLSFHLRLKKWAFALSEMNSFTRITFGLGPGYFGGAADSSFLRIIFETGILGILLWYSLLFKLSKKPYSSFIICVIINAVFIDTFYSSKICLITIIFFIFYERKNKTLSL
jgi:hypothetical protein